MSRFVFRRNQPAPKVHFSHSLPSQPGRARRLHWPCRPVTSVFPLVCHFLEEYFSDAAALEPTWPDAAISQADAYLISVLLVSTMEGGSAFFSVQSNSPTSFAF